MSLPPVPTHRIDADQFKDLMLGLDSYLQLIKRDMAANAYAVSMIDTGPHEPPFSWRVQRLDDHLQMILGLMGIPPRRNEKENRNEDLQELHEGVRKLIK
jgi:hypothetical protein